MRISWTHDSRPACFFAGPCRDVFDTLRWSAKRSAFSITTSTKSDELPSYSFTMSMDGLEGSYEQADMLINVLGPIH